MSLFPFISHVNVYRHDCRLEFVFIDKARVHGFGNKLTTRGVALSNCQF